MLWNFRSAATLALCSSLSALLGAQAVSNSAISKGRPSPAKQAQTSADTLTPINFQAGKAFRPGIQSKSMAAVSSPLPVTIPSAAMPTAAVTQPAKPDSSGMFAIDYRAGQLSVVADKAELGNVMKLLGEKIGASVEVSADVTTEPVVARLGPAAPNQILAELLDSSHLEYIVMGSDENGLGIQRIVVHKRAALGREPLIATRRQTTPVPESEPERAEPENQQSPVIQPAAEQPSVQPVVDQQANPPERR